MILLLLGCPFLLNGSCTKTDDNPSDGKDPEEQTPEGEENVPVSENWLDGEPTAYSVGTEREALV